MNKYKILLLTSVSVLLTGCLGLPDRGLTLNTASKTLGRYADLMILPEGGVKVARIYRTDNLISEERGSQELIALCQNDFNKTKALKTLVDKYNTPVYSELGTLKDTTEYTGNASIGGLTIGTATLGASLDGVVKVEYEYKDLKKDTAFDENDTQVIKSNIGRDCKKAINTYKTRGYGVYIITKTVVATEATITLKYGANAGLNASIASKYGTVGPKLGGTYKDDSKVTHKNLVVGVDFSAF